MPQQKMYNADPTNPTEISVLFRLAEALVLDGWGATVRANPQSARMVTNAPQSIIDFHTKSLFV